MAKKSKQAVAKAMGCDSSYIRPLPTLHLGEDYVKDVKNLKIGDKRTFTVEAEVKSISEDDYLQGDPISATFRIIAIDGQKTKKKKESYDTEEVG